MPGSSSVSSGAARSSGSKASGVQSAGNISSITSFESISNDNLDRNAWVRRFDGFVRDAEWAVAWANASWGRYKSRGGLDSSKSRRGSRTANMLSGRQQQQQTRWRWQQQQQQQRKETPVWQRRHDNMREQPPFRSGLDKLVNRVNLTTLTFQALCTRGDRFGSSAASAP
jgi:hypothetical protein